MELLIAILLALRVLIQPEMTTEQIKEKYPADYEHAQTIIETHAYHFDETTGIVIVEDGTTDNE